LADFTFITNRLSTGGNVGSPEDIQALRAAGITHVIDTRNGQNDAALFASSIDYLYNGANDDGQPKPIEWYRASIDFALKALALPLTKVHCYCVGGNNRGPSAAFAVLMAQGLNASEAEAMIRQKRPQVGLAYRGDAAEAVKALGYG
jgi:hypothetical protein